MPTIQQIQLTKAGGITLATARKYCAYDLRIMPRLATLRAAENGSYPIPDGYAGWGEVTVETPAPTAVPLIVTKNGTYRAPAGQYFSSVTVLIEGSAGTADGNDYTIAVGESFSIAYPNSSPTVVCPDCLEYTDDGGILIFTAIAATETPQTLRLLESDTLIGSYTVTVTADASGQTHIHQYTSHVTEPTCERGGYTTHTCTLCGDSFTDTPTPAHGHAWSDIYASNTFSTGFGRTCTRHGCGVSEETDECPHPTESLTVTVTAESTCTNEGEQKLHCQICGKTWTEPLPTTAHTYRTAITEPTCERGGYTAHICTACGDTYLTDETDPNGHNFVGGWITETEPTCTAQGERIRTCQTCGETQRGILAPLGHDWEYYEDSSASSGWSRRCTRCGVTENDVTREET